jgi:hypothetical protein
MDDATGEERETDGEIELGETGVRALYTLLFALIWQVGESILGVVAVFGIVWALITRRPPPARLREFSNRLVTYLYRVGRYVTYNEAQVPFPISDFPPALEPPATLD